MYFDFDFDFDQIAMSTEMIFVNMDSVNSLKRCIIKKIKAYIHL